LSFLPWFMNTSGRSLFTTDGNIKERLSSSQKIVRTEII
jgi:hypothetical protein